jgi:hypothetical protein
MILDKSPSSSGALDWLLLVYLRAPAGSGEERSGSVVNNGCSRMGTGMGVDRVLFTLLPLGSPVGGSGKSTDCKVGCATGLRLIGKSTVSIKNGKFQPELICLVDCR